MENLASTLSDLTPSSTTSKPDGLSALGVYAQLCASNVITVPPYDADAMINARLVRAFIFLILC